MFEGVFFLLILNKITLQGKVKIFNYIKMPIAEFVIITLAKVKISIFLIYPLKVVKGNHFITTVPKKSQRTSDLS